MDESTSTVRYDDGGLADAASPREARARRHMQALAEFGKRHAVTIILVVLAGILADIFLKKAFGIHTFVISFLVSGTVFALLGYAFYKRGRVLYERAFLDRRKNLPATPPSATSENAFEWGYSIEGVGLWLSHDSLGLVPDAGQYETYPWCEVHLDEAKLVRIGKPDLVVHLPHRRLRYSGDKLGLSAAEVIARVGRIRG